MKLLSDNVVKSVMYIELKTTCELQSLFQCDNSGPNDLMPDSIREGRACEKGVSGHMNGLGLADMRLMKKEKNGRDILFHTRDLPSACRLCPVMLYCDERGLLSSNVRSSGDDALCYVSLARELVSRGLMKTCTLI